MENNDLGLIKFNLSFFKELYNNDVELNDILLKKANELMTNYNCFTFSCKSRCHKRIFKKRFF